MGFPASLTLTLPPLGTLVLKLREEEGQEGEKKEAEEETIAKAGDTVKAK